MGARLIIVSNRVAAPDPKGAPAAGGMAVAVKAALKNRKGLWFGWSGNVSDDPDAIRMVTDAKKVTYVLVDLSKKDVQEYYNGLANQGPVADPSLSWRPAGIFARRRERLHPRQSEVRRSPESACRRGRRRLGARLPSDAARPGAARARSPQPDRLFPAHALRARRTSCRRCRGTSRSSAALPYYDLIGFQTANDRDNFARYLTTRGARALRGDAYEVDGRHVRLGVFGVSIETKTYMRLARNAGRSAMVALVKESLGGNKLVLGVDRLDYTKGIPDRIKAFERFLEENPDWRGKVTLLQITPKSRSDIEEYVEIEREVTGLIGKVNGRFGDAAWTPIRYVNRSYSRTVLAGMYRAADVAMVTPLRDGMNLVAKEYLAAQDPDDPGVLVLSRVRRRGARARPGADRQSARDGRGGRGAEARARNAGRRAARAPRPDARPFAGLRHHALGGGLSLGPARRWPAAAQSARRHPRAVRRIVRPGALRRSVSRNQSVFLRGIMSRNGWRYRPSASCRKL